ncbi:Dot/Icm T4SS effector v-ATPase inhibitor SidK [Legionella pneumophila serogroup 1]|uniref:Dot/Icm T4SS effector v-ATPase inhibitor SidK n=1 Tax=Legionella pneumophila TaxID=446 RepID=UPI00101E2E31|nr:Dot/Icm T4SS effector v-ATPase inhibitor SidK [Legionella pneumophila]HAT8820505.1 Dot/Icm T4SS effector v-ATPase inhibitor SidK [Legionella pneumophila subsp. pneumophila]MCZ4738926.1 Dot/Icm T4SS effector v-ATPase inhibitor SidK [Legionella pneumophila]MCZ4747210.1 Dot/Icm T4SS effector v-ATPase inhibitor SidK [Legionella pneumophila]MDO5157411.1 Dot/Icm T4SS effector v-ATPase inhibitor SidK [Legionella pneumophila]MDO5161550.1 Dot/Icm T4SS effector v-ATPase inhibitor SidK [Legionella pne
MGGLTSEQYHSQVVGKIGYIARCMQTIDPENNLKKIREDYQDVLIWAEKNYRFEEILEASKSGKCPNDLDALSRRSLILQELLRLVSSISPFKMKLDLIESQYEKMKQHVNLWKSDYHVKLNQLNQLTDYLKNAAPTPKNNFLRAMTSVLQMQIAQYGITEDNEGINQLFKLGLHLLAMANEKIDEQYHLFKGYVKDQAEESPFEGILPEEDQKILVKGMIDYAMPKLSSKVLQDKLSALSSSDVLTKTLLDSIDRIVEENEKLNALSKVKLGKFGLDIREIEEIYSQALKTSPQDALQYTAQQCDAQLLGMAFTDSQNYIVESISDKKAKAIADLIHSKEFIYQIIKTEVFKQVDPNEKIRLQAATELYQLLGRIMDKQIHLFAKMNLEQINEYIQTKTKAILDKIPERVELLTFMGFEIPTFKGIETLMTDISHSQDNETLAIAQEFYTNIKNAKKQLLGDKLIEDITPQDVEKFFNQCSQYGSEAAEKLADNRPVLTKIADILTAIARWAISLIGFNTPPQFLAPTRTCVDQVSDEITKIKLKLEDTLGSLQKVQEENLSL